MTRIFTECEIAAQTSVALTGNEAHYVTRVRRLTQGDTVEARTPSGRCFEGIVSAVAPDCVLLDIHREVSVGTRVLPIRLLVSLPKRRLLDDVIRMASELGVERICPVLCERTVVQPGGDKLNRWRRVAEESLRQCGRTTPLIIEEVQPYIRALEETPNAGSRFLFHPSNDAVQLIEKVPFVAPVTAAVGPEGGFTETETALALDLGFSAVRLNTPILRIETAAVAAAVLIAAHIDS